MVLRIIKFIETGRRTLIVTGWEEGAMGSSCLMEIVSFGEDEKLTIDDDDGYLII